ncbi:MAG: HEAT repeat domain-containing protein [Candidatus Poribacteria bacterium]|nr:HEAT repeat domain-containing protein [Candidatus Poribacteria bacterium]
MGPLRLSTNALQRLVSLIIAATFAGIIVTGCQQDPIAQAIKDVQSGTDEQRIAAATVLAQSRSVAVSSKVQDQIEPTLKTVLGDANPQVRRIAAKGLIDSQNPNLIAPAVETLAKDVAHETESVRLDAVNLLSTVATDGSTQALVAALSSSDPKVRGSAAKSLAGRTVSLTPEEKTRFYLASGAPHQIAELGDSVIPILVNLLDGDALLRTGAALAIGSFNNAAATAVAVQRVTNDLENSDAAVRVGAANALGALGDANAVPALQNLAENDPDAMVKASARVAAYVLRGDSVSLVQTLEDPNPQAQITAIRGARDLKDKSAVVAPLIKLLQITENNATVAELVITIGTCGAKAKAPLLSAIGSEPEWGIRLRLARALEHPSILASMNDNDEVTLYRLNTDEVNDTVKKQLTRLLNVLDPPS